MTAVPLALSDEQSSALERMARSTSLAVRQVTQAKALQWANEGEEIARRCGVDADTVRRWRRRFADTGVEGSARWPRAGAASHGCRRAR